MQQTSKGKYGYILFNQNDFYIGRSIEKYGEFSEGEVSLFRELCKYGDVVVEVVANIGTHTIAVTTQTLAVVWRCLKSLSIVL